MRWHQTVLLIGLFLGALSLQVLGAWQDSQTIDEGSHLTAGVVYWRLGDFAFNNPHPPLVKLAAGWPLLTQPDIRVDTNSWAWRTGNTRFIVDSILYRLPGLTGPQRYFFLGRLPVLAFWVGFGALVFLWARRRWGPWAGLLGLTVYLFDPNFLGHGHLINTDVPLAAMFFATFWAADRYFRSRRPKDLILLAVVFALAQITKFSAVILWPLLFGLGLIKLWYDRNYRWRHWWTLVGTVTLSTALIVWAAYGFEVKILKLPTTRFPAAAAVNNLRLPLPAGNYWRGLWYVVRHNEQGHDSALFGQRISQGNIAYFPVALAAKTPLLTLGLFLLAMAIGTHRLIRRWSTLSWTERIPFETWIFGLPPLLYFLISLQSNLNIGLRHLFPIYPFMFLAVGSLVSVRWPRWQRWWRTGLAAAGLATVGVAVNAWPNTIAYCNALAGGTNGCHRVLLDSNLDWGQDVWRLRRYLDEQRFARVRISLFTSIPPSRAYPETKPILLDADLAAGARLDDVIIVSVSTLYDPDSRITYLRRYRPTVRIGSSILVYDFRPR